jgi:glycosyltransferase involved in cell wall biosynthesis
MTRILRVIARLNVGGPAQHVVWLSEGMAGAGFETLLVAGTVPPGEEDMSGFAAARGVTPLIIPSMSRELSWRDVTTIFKLWRLMVRFQPDIVHTHTAKAGAVGRLAGLLYGKRCKFIHTFHGHIFHSYYGKLKTQFFLAVERILARLNTDRIVVLSQQQLVEIRDTFKIGRPEQFVVIPLGTELSVVGDRLSTTDNRQPTTPVVGIVGRLTPIKNHDLFLRVAVRMQGAARFVIYGDGAERERLERLAGSGVEFAGTRPIEEIYPALDVVALTSRNEGTPLALIEAMAAGKPVISTAVGGVVDLLGEIVERGEGYDVRARGITAASDDDAGFAAGLERLLRDDALCRRIVNDGKTYVEKHHSKERLIADMIRLVRRIEEYPEHN